MSLQRSDGTWSKPNLWQKSRIINLKIFSGVLLFTRMTCIALAFTPWSITNSSSHLSDTSMSPRCNETSHFLRVSVSVLELGEVDIYIHSDQVKQGIIVTLYHNAVDCFILIGWRMFHGCALFCSLTWSSSRSVDRITVPYYCAKFTYTVAYCLPLNMDLTTEKITGKFHCLRSNNY